MPEPSVQSTFVIERSYAVPVDRLYQAFADTKLKRRWFAEGEAHEIEQFEMDFRVGGAERLRYRLKEGTPFPGMVLEGESLILDLVPEARIVTASTMAAHGKRISASLVTIELTSASAGATLRCTHHGAYFERADGPRIRKMGWIKLFDRLGTTLA